MEKIEDQYIEYLIENKSKCSDILDKYFLDKITFNDVVVESESFFDILSFRKFIKSKKIDELLK